MKNYLYNLIKIKHLLPESNYSLGPKVIFFKVTYKFLDLIYFKTKKTSFKKIDIDDWDSFAINQSEILNKEAQIFSRKHLIKLNLVKRKIPFKMGGAADVKICYFLLRLLRPKIVVETGVAIGNSSRAILCALSKNNKGILYSSDLPYLSEKHSRNFIGIIVERKIRKRWKLFIGSDQENLREIYQNVKKIDFLHYDSDKSYHGRKLAIDRLEKKFSKNYVIVMDDIQDNSYFIDFVTSRKLPYKIFKVDNKYVGITGKNKLLFSKQRP